jgi:long-chain fatty acid transport protein
MMFKQTMISWSVAGALLVASNSVLASGFALIEQSASGMGNAFAGGAASAEDASTVFFNPAGISRLSGNQFALAAHAITPSAKYRSSTGVESGGDAGGTAVVPNAYLVMEMKPKLKFGLGVNAPFGLQTEYDSNWVGKYHAILSKLETVNVNPTLAYQVNEALSIGGGLDYQHINGELSEYKGGALGTAVIKGADDAWGYNVGLLYDVDPSTRLGIAYRSTIKYALTGTVTTSLPFANGPVTLDIELPDTLSFSAFHQYSERWDVMADVTMTGWSTFKQVKVVDASGATISNTPENWKDTVRVSLGATHHYNQKWSTRVGLAYDQTPVKDEFRTARIPDNNRTWLAFGGQYKPDASSAYDFGYAHLFVSDSTINASNPAPALVGTYKNKVDILSVQYTRNF